jgi:hypothetical protein
MGLVGASAVLVRPLFPLAVVGKRSLITLLLALPFLEWLSCLGVLVVVFCRKLHYHLGIGIELPARCLCPLLGIPASRLSSAFE